jgi:Fe2+ transport system protein FeoA
MEKKLSQMKFGENGIVKKIPADIIGYVTGMGLRLNKPVEISSKQPLKGPVVVSVGNSSISIGRNLAEKIIIEVK